jgi:hypothetical protein
MEEGEGELVSEVDEEELVSEVDVSQVNGVMREMIDGIAGADVGGMVLAAAILDEAQNEEAPRADMANHHGPRSRSTTPLGERYTGDGTNGGKSRRKSRKNAKKTTRRNKKIVRKSSKNTKQQRGRSSRRHRSSRKSRK